MAAVAEQAPLSEQVYRSLDEGRKREQIIVELIDKGHGPAFINELVQETSELRSAKRRTQGLVFMFIGAIVCLLSCVITITSGSTGNLPSVLFGLITLGVIVVFFGLMKVF